jgi:DNA-directed RNA polymerase subunit RPC12/RpoP
MTPIVQEFKEAKLSTTCLQCERVLRWDGKLDLDRRITCPYCGTSGTVREFVLARLQRKTDDLPKS